MPNPLNNFWRRFKKRSARLIHPDDLDLLKKHPGCFAAYRSWKDFLNHPNWDTSSELQVSLVPVPYWGDLLKSKVVILMSNPGFDPFNLWIEKNNPHLIRILWNNLHQTSRNRKKRFSFLDPELAWHTGFEYWKTRFKWTIKETIKKKNYSLTEALVWLSKRIACLQLVPYASISNDLPPSLIKKLPSSILAQEFANGILFQQAQAGQKLLIVARKTQWGLPEGSHIKNIFRTNNRGAFFECNSEIRDQIWKMLEL